MSPSKGEPSPDATSTDPDSPHPPSSMSSSHYAYVDESGRSLTAPSEARYNSSSPFPNAPRVVSEPSTHHIGSPPAVQDDFTTTTTISTNNQQPPLPDNSTTQNDQSDQAASYISYSGSPRFQPQNQEYYSQIAGDTLAGSSDSPSVAYMPSGAGRLTSPEASPSSHFAQIYNAQNPSAQGIYSSTDSALCSQKAVAFLAGPRERICVMGSPIECCPRCRQEGLGTSAWRPHRHIGELKIRYICERHFEDLESNHHFDIPLCPLCNSVLYLYEFNALLGVSNARRLHKYVLKCNSRHVLPLLDLFCQTKKGGERCNANFKLQWCYGTMVKRCEAQKNRDHDLWWVRYKNEWKQRRTIIRYKKDFLSHLSDTQRGLLLGLGLEGEPPPDPKGTLGPTFDALISSAGGSPQGPKIKKRQAEKVSYNHLLEDEFEFGNALKRRHTNDGSSTNVYYAGSNNNYSLEQYSSSGTPFVPPPSPSTNPEFVKKDGDPPTAGSDVTGRSSHGFPAEWLPNQVITGTPMNDLHENADGRSPVAVSVVGELCRNMMTAAAPPPPSSTAVADPSSTTTTTTTTTIKQQQRTPLNDSSQQADYTSFASTDPAAAYKADER